MLVLELAGVAPLTANAKQRMQKHERSTAVNALKALLQPAAVATLGRRRPRLTGPLVAVLEVQPPNHAHRDTDGWAPTLKAALDVIVGLGVIPDDCTCHVIESRLRALPVGDRWLIRLNLFGVTA